MGDEPRIGAENVEGEVENIVLEIIRHLVVVPNIAKMLACKA